MGIAFARHKFGLGVQICCGKILVAAEPAYSTVIGRAGMPCPKYRALYRAVSASVLYRHRVPKFHNIRSGNIPKVPPIAQSEKFNGVLGETFRVTRPSLLMHRGLRRLGSTLVSNLCLVSVGAPIKTKGEGAAGPEKFI